jgi:molecular chaperone DnaK
MKMGQAIYEKEQATNASGGGDAGAAAGADAAPAQDDVVDAEFSEVDDEAKR